MTPELGGDFLEPRRMIHRRTDDREIEAIRRADIAVAHRAQMKRETEADFRLAGRAPREVARRDFFGGDFGRAQCRRASRRRLLVHTQFENREEAIAHELQRLTPFADYGGD